MAPVDNITHPSLPRTLLSFPVVASWGGMQGPMSIPILQMPEVLQNAGGVARHMHTHLVPLC